MADVEARVKQFGVSFEKIRGELAKVIVGQNEIVENVLIAMLAGGHVLLEGLPGLGKTRLIKTIADAFELSFSRIQCTPDLMPADIIGTTILSEDAHGKRGFEFQRGPIFGNVVLTDEINRATPKTQSALLQAMQEGAVSVANSTWPLAKPFFVLATQNPIELEGTYPLPEAQLDRFMLKLLSPAPDVESLVTILERTTAGNEATINKVLSGEDLMSIRTLVHHVPAARPVLQFAARVVMATHPDQTFAPPSVRSYVKYGSSPRGAQAIVLCAKVRALLKGRFNMSIEDIKSIAHPALRHRVLLNFEGEAAGVKTDNIVGDILNTLKDE